ncbi:MAG TPA: ferritin-like domain-containing protein, partial [Burkholderiaceae bacterium]|nr:ferritin-like domain-containing protein [Burkholderiaceae bacterium]
MHEVKKTSRTGIDIAAIRAAAKNLDDGSVTVGYQADRHEIIALLNDALATELVCVLR